MQIRSVLWKRLTSNRERKKRLNELISKERKVTHSIAFLVETLVGILDLAAGDVARVLDALIGSALHSLQGVVDGLGDGVAGVCRGLLCRLL